MKVKLDEEKVKELFEQHTNQKDVYLALMEMIFPNYHEIKKIKGYPTVNKDTNKKLFRLWMDFDEKHHPDVFKGGLWLNNGLSSVEDLGLEDWEVDMSTCQIIYH
jgi:hypothetical protein